MVKNNNKNSIYHKNICILNSKCQYSICLLFPRRVLLAVSLSPPTSPRKIPKLLFLFFLFVALLAISLTLCGGTPSLSQSLFFILLKGGKLFFFLVLWYKLVMMVKCRHLAKVFAWLRGRILM